MIKVGCLLAVLLLVGSPPTAAAADQLGLSADGRAWGTTLERPLFASGQIWVPGDTETVSFWVRNQAGEPADLFLEILDVRGDLRLGSELRLAARVDGRRVGLDGGRPVLTVPADGVDPAEVSLTATLPVRSGNPTQRRSLAFRLRITLQGRSAPSLPDTGGPGLAVGGIGVLLASAGTLALVHRRRWTT